ncbi:Prolyl-tRNA synthetase associated domain-containing protein 1 [Glycine max]|nr:Prolyl-tRNA synthetase associated domain-containing protein 1 [Glycine max]
MGFSKQQLLARLKELQIPFSQYEHPVVLTVDAQRLGLGKGGLRMAPEEALGEVLQVPLGCVTPFALVNESARDVSLLLDQGFKSQKHCFFHPLSNDINRSYVDLEANPKVGKDQPPDLAALVPSGLIVLPDQPQKQSSSQVPEDANHVSMDNGTNTVSAKVVKPSSGRKSSKGTPAKNVNSSGSFADAGQFVEEILQKTSQLLLSEVKDENIKLHGEQLGTVLSDKLLKNLNAEFKNLAMIFKNTAYTEGFHAGTHYRPPLM